MSESRASAQELWQQILEELGDKATRHSFRSSLKQVQPQELDDNGLELVVATEFARDWLEKRGKKAISRAAEQVVLPAD